MKFFRLPVGIYTDLSVQAVFLEWYFIDHIAESLENAIRLIYQL